LGGYFLGSSGTAETAGNRADIQTAGQNPPTLEERGNSQNRAQKTGTLFLALITAHIKRF
jgi:hypothetical protein